MTVVDWFDPSNIEHLKAFNHLCDKGFWPEGFVPDSVEISHVWQVGIVNKIAMYYVRQRLSEEL